MHPILPEPEIRALVARYQAGDNSAADCIILHNERMIARIARRYYATGVTGDTTLEDLLQLGRMGMLRALRDFDLGAGHKFVTYAYWWVWQFIGRHGKRSGQALGLSYKASEQRGKIGRARAAFEQQHGRDPTLTELSNLTGLSVQRLARLRVNVVSLDFETATDANHRPLADALPDPSVDVEGEATERADAFYDQRIRQAVDDLPALWREVIYKRFGLGCQPMPLRELSAATGLTIERLRQIEKQALERLRENHLLEEFNESSAG